MSLLPIIYTCLAIFFGTFITILIISYITYKFRSAKKNNSAQHHRITDNNKLMLKKRLAHVPIYNINDAQTYQMNNHQNYKRDIHNVYNSTRIAPKTSHSKRHIDEKDYQTIQSRPRVQVVRRLSNLEEEPVKVSIKNTFYDESSLYKYYAQG